MIDITKGEDYRESDEMIIDEDEEQPEEDELKRSYSQDSIGRFKRKNEKRPRRLDSFNRVNRFYLVFIACF